MPGKPATQIRKRTAPPTGKIVSLEGIDLQFGNRNRMSPYRALLEQLLDASKNSVLRIDNPKARYSITKQARELGWKVAFAEHRRYLYVKIDGVSEKPATNPIEEPKTAASRRVVTALEKGPLTAAEVARTLKADPAACEAVLTELVRTGSVECRRAFPTRTMRPALQPCPLDRRGRPGRSDSRR
jgi:hypothetical protein